MKFYFIKKNKTNLNELCYGIMWDKKENMLTIFIDKSFKHFMKYIYCKNRYF